MSYAIFRTEPIYTLSDLSQIGSHNKREKKAYKSNPDIKLALTENNIELVPCNEKYVKKFYEITKEYKQEHTERMKTMREDRRKSFAKAVNDSKSVVADELLFTSDNEFFKDMNKEEIKKWADSCMDFVYKDLGYTKEQILHATVHIDEKTPHIHCVVVPLVKKFDKRTNCERYSISKKQYIKNSEHLSQLQDKYYQRLINNGFDLQRGIKGSDNEHLSIKELKKITIKLDKKMERESKTLNEEYNKLEIKLQSSKPTIMGNQVKIDKDTYEALNSFMSTAKEIIKETPKNQALFKELKEYTSSYKEIKRENQNIKYEVNNLRQQNEKLQQENNKLYNLINHLLQTLKKVFRKILKLGTEKDKDDVIEEITDYYDNRLYSKNDLYDIAEGTSKEETIDDYFYKSKSYNDRDMSL